MSRALQAGGVVLALSMAGPGLAGESESAAAAFTGSADVSGSAGITERTQHEGQALELGVAQPGDWKATARLRDTSSRPPHLRLHSAIAGAGGTQPQLSTSSDRQEIDLRIRRTDLGIRLDKPFSERLHLALDLSHTRRNGQRLSGRGTSCPTTADGGCAAPGAGDTGWAVLLLPEPVRDEHTQLEARLAYAGAQWQLSGGYHGSYFRNRHDSLTPAVPASLFNATGTLAPLAPGLQAALQQTIALPPDSDAHEVDVTGAYAFGRSTRLAFKVARAESTQRQPFVAGAPAGRTDLGGELVTWQWFARLTARPMPRVSLSGELNRRDRDDRTPVVPYHQDGTWTFTNRQLPQRQDRSKVQLLYQFDAARQGFAAAEHDAIDRGVFTPTAAIAGTTALRQHTRETTLRAGLRQRMAEGLGATVSLQHGKRRGSHWLRDNSGTGVTEVANPSDPASGFATGIFMPTLADRRRDEARFSADWQAHERLTVQLSAHAGRDRYASPSTYGLHGANTRWLGIDADYTLSPVWHFEAHASHASQRLPQSRPAAAIVVYDNRSAQAGFGVTAQAHERLQLGGTVAFVHDVSRHRQSLDSTASLADAELLAASGGLPDLRFKQRVLALFARGPLGERAHWRADLRYSHTRWNDWSHAYSGIPFPYADGSTALVAPRQETLAIGVRYVLRWP